MNLTTILIILSIVIAFVIFTMILLPKGAKTKEDIEKEKERLEEKPTSLGKWILIYLVNMIPVANLVMLFILAFKKYETNITVKNWAKTMLIFTLIVTVLVVALVILACVFFMDDINSVLNQYF